MLSAFSPRSAATRAVLTVLAATMTVAAVMAAGSAAPSDAASVRRVDLGAGNLERLSPNCGRNFARDCVAEGKVTIFQSRSGSIPGRTFAVPFAGKIISWSISLAAATGRDITTGQGEGAVVHGAQKPFFDSIFGTPASARIAVLRQVEKKAGGAPKFKLVRQGPVEILNPYFGTTVTFTLAQPLNVARGQIVALTVPTWAPAMWKPRACNAVYDSMLDPDRCDALYKKYAARTSRTPRGDDKCTLRRDPETGEPNEALAKSRPQTGVNSIRRFGCYYGPQVMLYSASIVAPD